MTDDSLEAIARTDALLDALAAERRFVPGDPDETALVSMLQDWRDESRRPPVTAVITEQQAVAAMHKGMAGQSSAHPRHRRGLTLVASIAATVLAIGGFGAVVAGSGPGDSLYSLRTALFGEKPALRDDRVALAAKSEMAEVQKMIDSGDWEQAQQRLEAVSTQVQSVDDVGTKTELIQQWNDLSVKVGTRDAEATLPPSVSGEPAPPPPPGVTLLELPTATTTPVTETTTSGTETTTPSGTETTTPSGTETTPSGTETTATTTGAAPATTTGATPATTPTSAAPATTTGAAPATTPTSKAPATTPTSVAATSTQAAATATSTPAAPTSTPAAPTSSKAPPTSTPAATTSSAPAGRSATTPTSAAPTSAAPAPVTTTTAPTQAVAQETASVASTPARQAPPTSPANQQPNVVTPTTTVPVMEAPAAEN